MNQPELGKLIAGKRREKRWTQEELVNKCGISIRTLQRIESGETTPRNFTIRSIANALEIDPSEFDRKDDPIDIKRKTIILFIPGILLSIGLYLLFLQETKENYLQVESRDYVYFFPKSKIFWQNNMKDTADYKFEKDIIQEYRGAVFLNKRFVAQLHLYDTVTYRPGKLLQKSALEIRPYRPFVTESFYGKGIIYIFPPVPLNYTRNLEEYEIYSLERHPEVMERGNKIYLDGTYIGDAFAGDTVEMTPHSTLIIKPKPK